MAGQTVKFATNGDRAEGYLALPKEGKGPGVIVLQEWWGLVPHIKDVCDRFATEGFVALAPDLYHGESADHPDDAGRLMMALEIDRTERDLAGAVTFLLGQEACASRKLGIIGYCMGGQLALFAASKNAAIGACADYYGIHPEVKPDFASIRCPVLGIFAQKDEFVHAQAVDALAGNLREAGVDHDFTTFEGVDHAFCNDSRSDVHDPAAAAKAWEKTVTFFRSFLN